MEEKPSPAPTHQNEEDSATLAGPSTSTYTTTTSLSMPSSEVEPDNTNEGDDGPPRHAPASMLEAGKQAPPREGAGGRPAGLEEVRDDAAPCPLDGIASKKDGSVAVSEGGHSVDIFVEDDAGPPSPFSMGGDGDAAMKEKSALSIRTHRATPRDVTANSRALSTQIANGELSPQHQQHVDDSSDAGGTIDAVVVDVTSPLEGPRPCFEGFLPEERRTVYEGVRVSDEQEMPPWWKQNRIVVGAVVTLLVVIVAAATAGAMVAWNSKNNQAQVDTPQRHRRPPPMLCTAEFIGKIYEEDCNHCNNRVARYENTIVVFSDTEEHIQFLDAGTLEILSSHVPDHYVREMFFSSDSFFATNPYPTGGYGSIVVRSWDPSSGFVSNETMLIAPNPEEIDIRAEFGIAIDVEDDLLVVGAPKDAGGSGSVFVYRQTGPLTWVQEGKLLPDDPSVRNFGSSVLVEDDSIVVGAEGNAGAVLFYEFDSSRGTWQRMQNSTLFNDDCDGEFGASLAFTKGGGLMVGCPLSNVERGAVFYYKRSDEGRYELEQKLTARDGQSSENFGGNKRHLAVNSNGDRLAVGTCGKFSGLHERLHVFDLFGDGWVEVAKINAPKDTLWFGRDVVVSGDRIQSASWENIYSYALSCVQRMLRG